LKQEGSETRKRQVELRLLFSSQGLNHQTPKPDVTIKKFNPSHLRENGERQEV